MLRKSTQHVCPNGLVAILFAAAVSALAGERLPVVVTNETQVPAGVLAEAEGEVVRIFQQAGIEVRIQDCSIGPGKRRCGGLPANTRYLQLVPRRPPKGAGKHALGYAEATAAGGDCAWIFMPQVDDLSAQAQPFASQAQILGHAMAHELGHLLVGPGHWPHGLMRTNWSRADFEEMSKGLLLIPAADAARMRMGVRTAVLAMPAAH